MDEYIRSYENILTPEECQYYISLINNGEQHAGIMSSGTGDAAKDFDKNIKNSMDVDISEQYPKEIPALINKCQSVCYQYMGDLNATVPIYKVEHFYGRVYKKGEGFYKTHADAVNQDTGTRSLTILFYLNDITEGGEIEFPRQGIKIQPRQGLCVIFPSAWMFPHGARIPLSDDRYIIRTFTRMDIQ